MATGECESRLAVYRQQFAELEQDRKNGTLNDELFQQAQRELERRLLDESGSTDLVPAVVRRRVNSLLVAVLLLFSFQQRVWGCTGNSGIRSQ